MGQSHSKKYISSRTDEHGSQKDPEVRPGPHRKSDVISDPSVFKHIDDHVFRASYSYTSVSALKTSLVRPAKNDLEKVRAFYVFATTKNWKLRQTNNKQPQNHELFLQLCKEEKIPCLCVSGFSKRNNSDPAKALHAEDKANHCWNLVYVGGQWWPVDCSWGENKTNEKTVSAIGEFYFLCDPAQFVQSHLPWKNGGEEASARLQLLKRPWSLEEFNSRVRVDDKGVEFGIQSSSLSHTNARLVVKKELVLQIRANADKMSGLLAELCQRNTKVTGHTLVRGVGPGCYRVRVRPPTCGDYQLQLYGKPSGKGDNFLSILRYAVTCTKASKKVRHFPRDQNVQNDVTVHAQKYGISVPDQASDVIDSKNGKLDISLPLAGPIVARGQLKFGDAESNPEPNDLDQFVHLTASPTALRIEARFPHAGFYALRIFACKNVGDDSADLALTLMIHCRKGLSPCHGFPDNHPAQALPWMCRLLEPQEQFLPAHSVVKVRLSSPSLVRVEPNTLVKDGDVWRGLLMTGEPHSTVTIYGSGKPEGPLKSIYKFKVTSDKSRHSCKSCLPLPDLLPARGRKRDVIPTPHTAFITIDRHALQVPEAAKASVPKLARQLTRHASSDVTKARAFFYWITHNIRYDLSVYRQSNDPETVLKRGTAVCKGYSNLFQALCSCVGIPCHFVSGLDKAETTPTSRSFRLPALHDPLPLTPSGQTGHAWNVVLIGGSWRHVDCTFGAGKVKDGVFHQEFQELYFLTDPEDFVTQHLPLMEGNHEMSSRFQLLEKPWTLQEFNAKVKPTYSALVFGLRSSHTEAKVVFSGEVEIEIRVNPSKMDDMMAELKRGKEGKEVTGQAVVLRAGEGVYKVKVAPPERGSYTLSLLGHPVPSCPSAGQSKREVFIALLEYDLQCQTGSPRRSPYPKDHPVAYGPTPIGRKQGLSPEAMSISEVTSPDGTLDIRVPLTSKMAAEVNLLFAETTPANIDLNRYIRVSSTSKELHVEGRLPRPGFYRVSVFARAPSQSSAADDWECVLNLLVRCQRGRVNCQPF